MNDMAKRWTEEEKSILRDNYSDLGPKGCAVLLNRPESSVKSIANRSGLKYENKSTWTKEQEEFLVQELKNGLSHKSIGLLLNKTKSSIMHKVQTLGISEKGVSWSHLSDDELLDLVREYKSAEEFDTNPRLPSYKTLVKRFKVDNWNAVKTLAGVSVGKNTGRYDYTKPAIFYVIEFQDTDGTHFKKYGVTQRSVALRYRSRNDFTIVYEKAWSLQEALDKEVELSKQVKSYIPKDSNFTSSGHGGYTECFTNYINKPEWIDHG